MKLSKLPILVLAAAALAGSGCSRDDFDSGHNDYATLDFALTADDSVDTGKLTRAEGTQTIAEALNDQNFTVPSADDFKITIKNTSTKEEIYNGALKDYNSATEIPLGTYEVTAVYDNKTEGFYSSSSNPAYFKGTATLTVAENKLYEVEIPVTLQNSILKVAYTDLFKAYYENYSVTVKNKGITFATSETRGAFIASGDTTLSYTCTPTQAQGDNKKQITKEVTIEDLEKGKSYTLTFNVTNVGSVPSFNVSIDDTVVDALNSDGDDEDTDPDGEVDINQDEYIDEEQEDESGN